MTEAPAALFVAVLSPELFSCVRCHTTVLPSEVWCQAHHFAANLAIIPGFGFRFCLFYFFCSDFSFLAFKTGYCGLLSQFRGLLGCLNVKSWWQYSITVTYLHQRSQALSQYAESVQGNSIGDTSIYNRVFITNNASLEPANYICRVVSLKSRCWTDGSQISHATIYSKSEGCGEKGNVWSIFLISVGALCFLRDI